VPRPPHLLPFCVLAGVLSVRLVKKTSLLRFSLDASPPWAFLLSQCVAVSLLRVRPLFGYIERSSVHLTTRVAHTETVPFLPIHLIPPLSPNAAVPLSFLFLIVLEYAIPFAAEMLCSPLSDARRAFLFLFFSSL